MLVFNKIQVWMNKWWVKVSIFLILLFFAASVGVKFFPDAISSIPMSKELGYKLNGLSFGLVDKATEEGVLSEDFWFKFTGNKGIQLEPIDDIGGEFKYKYGVWATILGFGRAEEGELLVENRRVGLMRVRMPVDNDGRYWFREPIVEGEVGNSVWRKFLVETVPKNFCEGDYIFVQWYDNRSIKSIIEDISRLSADIGLIEASLVARHWQSEICPEL